jgi:hypothetical protein
MGKIALIISGVIGLPSGPRGGSMGDLKSAAKLYHWRGISDSERTIRRGPLGFLSIIDMGTPFVLLYIDTYNVYHGSYKNTREIFRKNLKERKF